MTGEGTPISVHDLLSILFAPGSERRTVVTLRVRYDGSILLGLAEADIAMEVNQYWLLEDEVFVCPHCVVEQSLALLVAECWSEDWLFGQYRDRCRTGRPTEVSLTLDPDGWRPTFKDAADEPWVYSCRICVQHCAAEDR